MTKRAAAPKGATGRPAAAPKAGKRAGARTPTATGRAAAARPGSAGKRSPRKSPPSTPFAEQPWGAGVADAFAMERLGGPAQPIHDRGGVREIGWAEFGDLALDLSRRIAADWAPDVVLAIANAGVFVGGAIAPVFGAELVHLHLPGRGHAERLPRLNGKKVLVVDDAANSGKTLDLAVKAAQNARAAEVRSAVIALRPGGAHPDWSAIETSDVVVFGWDYQFHGGSEGGDPGDAGV